MIRQDIQQERKCFNTLLMAMHRYDKVLHQELATLADEEEYCQSIDEMLRKYWE